MEWDKIWAINKQVIDPVSARFTAVANRCTIELVNGPDAPYANTVPLHKAKEDLGNKPLFFANKIIVERDDAVALAEGEKITLLKWGNAKVLEKKVADDGSIALKAELNVEDQDFKGTKKLTWIADVEEALLPVDLYEYDHLITKKKLEDGDDVDKLTNHNSKLKTEAIGEGSMRNLKVGDIIQIERRGFFYVDKASLGL